MLSVCVDDRAPQRARYAMYHQTAVNVLADWMSTFEVQGS